MNEQRFFKRVLTRVGELELPPGDVLIARSLELYGEWAQAELDVICVCLNRGDTVIDIGACFGTHALSFAEAVGPTGRVFAIEGSSANFEYLTRNCRRNAGANVRALLAVVVADGKSAYEETHDDENWGGTRFAPASPGSVSPPLAAVSVDSLDVGQVDFMKIDVEGMESEVLAGAHATIQAHRPIIFFEVNSVEQGLKACEALRKYSYDLYGVVTPAYTSGNFRKELHNIFGDAAECGVLAVANDRENSTRDILRRLPRIKTADDLALLLLHKPQYAGHDIGLNVAAKVLGLPPSPSRLKACLAESNAQVADRDARLKSSIAEAETLRAERDAVADENAQLRELVGKAKILACSRVPLQLLFPQTREIPGADQVAAVGEPAVRCA